MKKQSLARKLLALLLVFMLSAGLAMPVLAYENGEDENGYEYENGYEENGEEAEYPEADENGYDADEYADENGYDEEPADENDDDEDEPADETDEVEEAYEDDADEDDLADVEPITAPVEHVLTVEVDGVEVVFVDQGPIMVAGGTVMVPVRGVFEHMGFTPSWDAAAQVATLDDGVTLVVIPADGTTFTVNGETFTPFVPQMLLNDRVMLPLRAIAEALGATPDWDGDTLTAHILTSVVEEPVVQEPVVEEPVVEEPVVEEPVVEEPVVEEDEYDYDYPVVDEDEDDVPADEDEDANEGEEPADDEADEDEAVGAESLLVGTWVIYGVEAELWSTTFYADGTGRWVNNFDRVDYFVWTVEGDLLSRYWDDDVIWVEEDDSFTNFSSIRFAVEDGVLIFIFEDGGQNTFIPY